MIYLIIICFQLFDNYLVLVIIWIIWGYLILIYFGLFELFDYDYLSLFVLIMCNYLIKIILNYLLFMRSNNPAQHTHTHTPFYTPNTHGYTHAHTRRAWLQVYQLAARGQAQEQALRCQRSFANGQATSRRRWHEPATVARAGDSDSAGTSRRRGSKWSQANVQQSASKIMWLHRWTPQREVAGGDDLNDLMSKTIAAIAERVENNVIYFIDTGEKWPSVASIASVIGAEVWLSSLVAFFLPVLVCQCQRHHQWYRLFRFVYPPGCSHEDRRVCTANSSAQNAEQSVCTVRRQDSSCASQQFSILVRLLCTVWQTLRRVISASLSISKPPVHANKGKSVSTDKNGQNRQVFLSEKERYSNSFGRGQQALGMTSSLDARGHYGWLHPWTPQMEGDSLRRRGIPTPLEEGHRH